jgi:hypothetical protein
VIRVCSYCRRVLGEKEPLADKRITHCCYDACCTAILDAQHDPCAWLSRQTRRLAVDFRFADRERKELCLDALEEVTRLTGALA